MQNAVDGKREKPLVGITMGDPAGVGPEIILKALQSSDVWDVCVPIVIGDVEQIRRTNRILHGQVSVVPITSPAEARGTERAAFVLQVGNLPADLPLGELSKEAGEAAYRYVVWAVELAQAGKIDAICTAPLNKEAMQAAGHPFPGHTELLGHLTGRKDFAMVLVSPSVNVAHVSTHVGLRDAIDRVKREREEKVITIGAELMQDIGISRPRIAVCGLNPHAGEHGLFGEGEEEREIAPAVEAMQAKGYDVVGPLPADTVFYRAQRGDFDLVIAQYHDQGHIPVKALGMDAGVNVTAGLPILRTSVDHGTAFDIAGKGIADAGSMIEAILLAGRMAAGKSAAREQAGTSAQ